mmetsp:Transcript_38547/g.43420  ORF Transcript_38547/g.43420 Transcript_38547/m.43420 type:complete len:686 (+) Transcript_38547:100-2157(+)
MTTTTVFSLLPMLMLPLLLLIQALLLPSSIVSAFNTHTHNHNHHQFHHRGSSSNINSRRGRRTTTTITTTDIVPGQRLRPTTTTTVNGGGGGTSVTSLGSSKQPPVEYVPLPDQPLGDSNSKKSLYPKNGDIVRYYDLDGGIEQGVTLVGKISYIFGSKQSLNGFSVELNELEDVGEGYYAEYSSAMRSRSNRKCERPLSKVSPIAASFVGSEQAYKIPLTTTKEPMVRQESYDVATYQGPSYYTTVNQNIVEKDLDNYQTLKSKLFTNVLLTGLVGTIIINASYNNAEYAVIYFGGSVSSLLYLFLLSLKTDTVAINETDNTKNLIGTPIASLRFATPALLLIVVSIYNSQKMVSGLSDTTQVSHLFDTVTKEQFTAAVSGFLTYRVPLFFGQIRDAFSKMALEDAAAGMVADAVDSSSSSSTTGVTLPGSMGVAAKLFSNSKNKNKDTTTSAVATTADAVDEDTTVTVLLVSGPQATGRSELVKQLLQDDTNLVPPDYIYRRDDGATFERLERRNEFLDNTGGDGTVLNQERESGLIPDGIFEAAKGDDDDAVTNKNVVVIDASIDLAKRITESSSLPNVRIIGVWIGLNSVQDFEYNIQQQLEDGTLVIPPDEYNNEESYMRAKIKEIISEIDYGLGSGIFEFTILNSITNNNENDTNDSTTTTTKSSSLLELKEAASYAFK